MRILLLEDDAHDAELLEAHLAREGLEAEIVRVSQRAAFESALVAGAYDLVLSDYHLPTYDGRTALESVQRVAPDVPFIFVSGMIGEEAAIDSLKAGATDYVLKHRLERLGPSVRRALREREGVVLRRAMERERDELHAAERLARAEAERAAAESRLLADASKVLASSLDLRDTLGRVLELMVPAAVDWAAIELVDDDGAMRCVATAHYDARGAAALAAREGDAFGIAGVLASRRAVRAVREPEHVAPGVDAIRVHSWIVAPIVARDVSLGALLVGASDGARPVSDQELALAEEVAVRIALAVDNARLYAQAQRDRARAEEANRHKDEFLATVSHELRTPLNAILGWTRMLREGTLAPDKQRRAIDIVERNARAQTQLIEDLLDVSRIITGKLRLTPAPLELSTVVEMAIEAIRPQAEARGVQLESATFDEPCAVIGDADRLQQVVWNLLTNAVKFTPQRGRVEVRMASVAGAVELSISDTGAGISPEFLPHVFDRFRQADMGNARKHGGLGLGLTIVRHIVELHGGTIGAHSEGAGRGATFTVRLPAAASSGTRPRVAAVARPSMVPTLHEAPRLTGLRVLVVDDEADARDLLVSALSELEAKVTAATTVSDALDAIRRERPDVLVSDIGMPGEDGYSLIERVRALGPAQGGGVPAIALTAFAAIEDRSRALDAGFDRHVPKPVEPSELAMVIAEVAPSARRTLGMR